MSFNLLAVREAGTADDPLYPTPGEQADGVELRADDGQPSPPFVASELIVHEIPSGGAPKRLLRLHDIKATVRTTDSRIVVACPKYEKGGGWTPWTAAAIPVALAANAVSKVRASRRRQGKMLVGQVPYKWLLSVGFRARATPMGHDRLRLGTVDPTLQTFRGLLLDLTLPRQQAGAELARRITALAAACRLASGEDLDDNLRAHLDGLRDPTTLSAQPKQFASYFLIADPDQSKE